MLCVADAALALLVRGIERPHHARQTSLHYPGTRIVRCQLFFTGEAENSVPGPLLGFFFGHTTGSLWALLDLIQAPTRSSAGPIFHTANVKFLKQHVPVSLNPTLADLDVTPCIRSELSPIFLDGSPQPCVRHVLDVKHTNNTIRTSLGARQVRPRKDGAPLGGRQALHPGP